MPRTIVLAYSGGEDGPQAILDAGRRHAADVVTVTLDIGQDRPVSTVRDAALAAGAVRAHVIDAADAFLRSCVMPLLHVEACRPGGEPPPVPPVLPLVAARLVEMARLEGAATVVHGAAPGNAAVFARLVAAQDAALECDAWRRVELPSRVRSTCWGRSLATHAADPRWPAEAWFTLTRPVDRAPDAPAHVAIRFDSGVPVALNDIPMSLAEIFDSLTTIAGVHGVGRFPAPPVRAGTHAVHEAPAAVVLHAAHAALVGLRTSAAEHETALARAAEYRALMAEGGWFEPRRAALDTAAAAVEARVTGVVRLSMRRAAVDVMTCVPDECGCHAQLK